MTRQRIMHRQPAGSRAKEVTKDASDMSARRAARDHISRLTQAEV
jgi:hypothetical protein